MTSRRVLVITSCTGTKAPLAEGTTVPAEDLYAGEQHRRLMIGVRAFRAASTGYELDLRILSAGSGLVGADERLADYDSTFAGLRVEEISARADELSVKEDMRTLLSAPFELGLMLLGADYLRAARVLDVSSFDSPMLIFCGRSSSRQLLSVPNARIVPAGKDEARRFGCGLVGLKGHLAGRMLTSLAGAPAAIRGIASGHIDPMDLLSGQDQLGLAA